MRQRTIEEDTKLGTLASPHAYTKVYTHSYITENRQSQEKLRRLRTYLVKIRFPSNTK